VAAKKFIPSLHPRDRFGRFTHSGSGQATAVETKAAQKVASGLKAKRGVTGANAGAYLAGFAPEGSRKAVSDYTGGGYVEVHKALRGGDSDSPAVKAMDAAMIDLPDDLVLSRRVPVAAFGKLGPESLVGLKVRDAAYAPTSIGTIRPAKDSVRMRIAAPAGTRAAVDPETGEVILDRDMEMVVARVEDTPAGVDMYVTVLPKQRSGDGKNGRDSSVGVPVRTGTAEDGVAPRSTPKRAAKPAAVDEPAEDTPAGGADEVRAELMRKKLPELRADAKTRGLKGYSKLRKSQLVDVIVADETGAEPDRSDADGQPDADVPRAGEDAMPAAPLSLIRDNGVTALQRKAFDNYRSAQYQSINGALRGGPSTPQLADRIDTIDAAMAASPLTADVEVHRGLMSGRSVFGDRMDGDLSGMIWREDAYLSTSASARMARLFAMGTSESGEDPSPVQMRISVPAGVGAVELSGTRGESELLLARSHQLAVTEDRGVDGDGVRHLDVVVFPRPAKLKLPDAPGREPAPAPSRSARPGTSTAKPPRPAVAEQGPAPAVKQTGAEPERTFDDRLDTAAKAKKALEAAPIGLRRKPDQLTKAQREALNGYRLMQYSQINGHLRYGGGDAQAINGVTQIDSVMAASKLTSDVQLWRGLPATRDLFGDRSRGDLTGIEWREDAYVSTSASRKVSEEFADPQLGLLMRIVAPAGSGGVQVSSTYEAEILLDRGQRFRVVADNGRTPEGRRMIDVEVLPANGTAPAKPKTDSPASPPALVLPPVDAGASPQSVRATGTDLVGALKSEATPINEIDLGQPFSPLDRKLGAIAQRQGFDAPAQNVDSATLDAAVASGWVEIWRGTNDSPAASGETQLERLRRGDWELSRGIYGNGVYTSERRETADEFAAHRAGGRVVRMGLDPQAKLVDLDDLRKEHRAWMKSQRKLTENERMMFTSDPEADLIKIMEDPGRFAAARGYDAIRIVGKDDGAYKYPRGQKRATQYAVLNRSVLMIQEGDFVQ
jgi:hypothetical protein